MLKANEPGKISAFTWKLNIKSSVHGIQEPGLNSKHGNEQQGHTKKTTGELKCLNDLKWGSFLG